MAFSLVATIQSSANAAVASDKDNTMSGNRPGRFSNTLRLKCLSAAKNSDQKNQKDMQVFITWRKTPSWVNLLLYSSMILSILGAESDPAKHIRRNKDYKHLRILFYQRAGGISILSIGVQNGKAVWKSHGDGIFKKLTPRLIAHGPGIVRISASEKKPVFSIRFSTFRTRVCLGLRRT